MSTLENLTAKIIADSEAQAAGIIGEAKAEAARMEEDALAQAQRERERILADAAVQALLDGSLAYDPEARCDHHDHAHGAGHTCGEHGCGEHSCHS